MGSACNVQARQSPSIGVVSSVSALSLLGLVLSLGVQLLISGYFGTSAALDAYLFAYSIAMATTFFIGPIRDASGPRVFASLTETPGQAARQLEPIFGWVMLGLLLSVAAALAAALAFERGWIAVSPAIQDLAGGILLWLAPAVLLLGCSEMLNGLFACYNRPVLQQVVRLIAPTAMIVAIVLLVNHWGVRALAAGVLLGNAVMVLVQYLLLARLGLKLRVGWPRAIDGGFLVLSGALLLNYGLAQVYAVVEKAAFTSSQTGLMSAFNYGTAITNVVVTLLGMALAKTIYPQLLTAARKKDRSATAAMVGTALQWLVFLATGMSAAIWVAAEEVVRVLFARGQFDAVSVALTTGGLRAAVFACVPIGVYMIVGHALLAWQSQRALAGAGLALAAGGMVVLALGVLADSRTLLMLHWLVGNTVGAVLAIYYLRHHLQDSGSGFDTAIWRIGRILGAGVLTCSGASYIPVTIGIGPSWVVGMADGSVALAAYMVLCWLLRAVPAFSPGHGRP